MFNKLFPINSKRRKFLKRMFPRVSQSINREEIAYRRWRKCNLPSAKQLEEQRTKKFDYMPKISIIVPVYNTPEKFFEELVNCMKNQTYSNWELCLADGSPTPLEFRDKYMAGDERIKYKTISENKGISGNTNEALSLATGDYIGLLDHDDYLPEYSLYEVVKTINENRDVEFIYTDEDKFEEVGKEHYGVFFKPDFSPYTLNSANYICHFSIFKKELMDKLSGFKSEYDGSQDFDIVSRATTLTDKIVHIPNVLYNWRVHQNSTASGGDNVKPYAYEIAKSVIRDHLKRRNISAEVVDGDILGSYRVVYKPNGNPLISLILDTNNCTQEEFDKLVEIIESLNYKNVEYIIISDSKYNFGKEAIYVDSYQKAIQVSKGEYFFTIDEKLFKIENKNIFEDLIGICQNSDVAVVGTKLYNENDLVLHNGIILGMCGIGGYVFRGIPKFYDVYMARLKIIHNVSAVCLKYSLIKKEEYLNTKGFEYTDFSLAQYIDFCLKCINNKKNIVLNPLVEIGIKDLVDVENTADEVANIRDKWQKDILNDRYYNKNLKRDSLNISVKDSKVEESV